VLLLQVLDLLLQLINLGRLRILLLLLLLLVLSFGLLLSRGLLALDLLISILLYKKSKSRLKIRSSQDWRRRFEARMREAPRRE
jgi:hypothetical protein